MSNINAEPAMISVYFDKVVHKLSHNDGWTATSADPEVTKGTEVDIHYVQVL